VSGPRRLWVRFRRVDPMGRDAYREAVRATNVAAGTMGANFWAFEVDGGEDRFVEFMEGSDDPVLAALLEATDESLRVVGGELDSSDLPNGSRGLRCTEFA